MEELCLLCFGVESIEERLTGFCQCKEVVGIFTSTSGLVVEVLDPILHAQAIDHQLHQLVADLVALICGPGLPTETCGKDAEVVLFEVFSRLPEHSLGVVSLVGVVGTLCDVLLEQSGDLASTPRTVWEVLTELIQDHLLLQT